MTDMRAPHLDEDVRCGCNQNVIKPNSERTQENRHLLSNLTADERKYFKLRLSALHDCASNRFADEPLLHLPQSSSEPDRGRPGLEAMLSRHFTSFRLRQDGRHATTAKAAKSGAGGNIF